MRIITEPVELISRYVSRKTSFDLATSCAAVGLVNDDDELLAGAVFTGYRHPNIFMSIACEKMTPSFVAAFIHYPFVQLKCTRLSGLVNSKNTASRKFSEHLGAKLEGVMRQAAVDDDICIYGLLEKDARRWLKRSSLEKLEAAW